MPSLPPLRLDPDLARFVMGGVSINAGSASAEGHPSLCRAFGCRTHGDDTAVVFFSRLAAADLLRDVAAGRSLAVVFSDPPTHRTLQVKGSPLEVRPLEVAEQEAVAAYRTAFVARLAPLGFPEPLVRALLDCPDGDLVAVRFRPEAAFIQTPGAQAGSALGAAQP